MNCRCMEFVVVDWYTRKWLRLYQAIGDFTSGDLGKRLGSCIFQTCLREKWRRRAPLDDGVNGSYVDVSLKGVVRVVLVLLGVGPVLNNGYGN